MIDEKQYLLEFDIHEYKELTKIIQNKKYKFLAGYTIIDYDSFNLLDFLKYNLNNLYIIDIYEISYNKFILVFKNYKNNDLISEFKYCNIILGYFDDYKCFNPEYLFDIILIILKN